MTIRSVFSPAEAQLVRSCLEAAGIPATVVHEAAALSMDGYSMATGGILVQVMPDRAEEARALLSSIDTAQPATGPANPPAAEPAAMEESGLATVFRTFDAPEADLVRSLLEVAGIGCVVLNETAEVAAAPLAKSGILVRVPTAQAAEARALIAANDANDAGN